MQYKMPPVVHCSVHKLCNLKRLLSQRFYRVKPHEQSLLTLCQPQPQLIQHPTEKHQQKSVNNINNKPLFFFQFSLLIIPWVSRPRPAEKHSTIVTGSEHFKCISVVGGGTCFLHFYPGGSQPLSEINLNIRGLESTTSCLFHSLFLEFVLCRHNASRRPNKRQNILIYVLFYTFFFFKIKKIKCITLGH